MEYIFKNFDGESVGELSQYLRAYIDEHPGVKIYVGCDSTVGKKCINFVIAIVLYIDGKGGHIIYARETQKIHSLDKFSLLQKRLLKEVENSLKVADYIEENLKDHIQFVDIDEKICDIHLDLNPDFGDGRNKSNIVYEEGKGWVLGSGYRVCCKPFAFAATAAADKLLR